MGFCPLGFCPDTGRRKRGRPKRRWLDKVKDDIIEKGLSADDVYDRATWRRMSQTCQVYPFAG